MALPDDLPTAPFCQLDRRELVASAWSAVSSVVVHAVTGKAIAMHDLRKAHA